MFKSIVQMFERGYHRAALRMPGRELRRKWKFRLRLLSLVPPLTGFAVLLLLAGVPQMREVYLGIIEEGDFLRGALGFVVLLLVCAMLYVWHYWLGNYALDSVYPEHADVHFDVELMRWRDVKALVCAALPLAGLVIGLLLLRQQTIVAATVFDAITDHFKSVAGDTVAVDFSDTRRLLGSAYAYVTFLLLAAVAAAIALVAMWLCLRRAQRGHAWRVGVSRSAGVVTLAASVLPLVMPDAVVPVTRAIGPLATVLIAVLALVSTMAFVSWVIKSLDPAFTKGLSAFVAIVLGGSVLWTFIAPGDVSRGSDGKSEPKASDVNTRAAFRGWLETRQDRASFSGSTYPVFVFAAQGGGIYAASAASGFLAAMQDSCTNFAEHVFAVSAVSGGAVGAAVFTGLMQSVPASPRPCGAQGVQQLERTQQVFTRRAEAIMLDDHLSPVVSMVAPDLMRKVTNWIGPLRAHFDRSNALERGFACSFDAYSRRFEGEQSSTWALPSLCHSTAEGAGLRAGYADVWKQSGVAPALILNATWAEMGYRVAFAPFPLWAVGDGTLFSYDELLPSEKQPRAPSLVEAAFVSARFPGLVPARTVEPRIEGNRKRPVWNFVDGGYADNSGATTALEIYKLIEDMRMKEPLLNVEPYLVLLTDAETSLVYKDISGSRLSDTLVPVEAMLNVRRRLAQRAVTQAIEYIAKSRERPSNRLGAGEVSRIMIVDVEQQSFRLPLGWKISHVTNDIVRLMMGRPDLCPETARSVAETAQPAAGLIRTIEHNSCVKQRIATLLQGDRAAR